MTSTYDANIRERQLKMTDGSRLTLKVYRKAKITPRKAKITPPSDTSGFSDFNNYNSSGCNTIHRSNGLTNGSLMHNSMGCTPRSFSSELLFVEPQPRAQIIIPEYNCEGAHAIPNGGRSSSGLKERSSSLGNPTVDDKFINVSTPQRQRSVTAGGPAVHHSTRTNRQRPSYKRSSEDDDRLKKSRAWANAYELSQDLHDKQMEMLERKYGGHLIAKRAARIIQQAYRQYSMTRNFERLRTITNEKRLSRRWGNLERSNTIWTDMVMESGLHLGMQMRRSHTRPENVTLTNSHLTHSTTYEDNLNQNHAPGNHTFPHYTHHTTRHSTHMGTSSSGVHVTHSDYNISSSRQVIHKSHTSHVSVTSTRERVIRQQHSKHIQHSTSAHSGMGLDPHQLHPQDSSRDTQSEPRDLLVAVSCEKSIPVTSLSSENGIVTSPTEAVCNNAHAPKHKAVASVVDETNNNRNSYPELNDSSGSDSPRETPVEPAIDLPSVNFENLLEAKETDILNDSFHSDSSQNSQSSTHHNHHGSHHPAHHHICKHHQRSLSGTCNSYAQPVPTSGSMDDILAAEQMTPRIGDRHELGSGNVSDSICSDTGSLTGDIQVHIEDAELNFIDADSDRTPTQDENVITKVYANTEVRLRNKKKTANQESAQDSSGLDGQSQSQLQTSSQPVSKLSPEASPIWKRKSAAINGNLTDDVKRMSNISEASEPDSCEGRNSRSDLGAIVGSTGSSSDNASVGSGTDQYVSVGYSRTLPPSTSTSSTNSYKRDSPTHTTSTSALPKMTSRQHKRLYRIGLNLFNKKPEKGMNYLIERRFVGNQPLSVAKFLISRKGLSKWMIGEYLGNLQKQFNLQVLQCFAEEIDLSGLQIDVALRVFQTYFRMPGEAQKIERLMEAFAHRFCMCNPDQVKLFRSPDTVFLLAFAIIMLNTDLHNTSIKAERKMKLNDFKRNLRGIDDGEDIDPDLLTGIYERIKSQEFKPGTDHVSQVLKVEQMIVGKKPNISLPHRRLVCYCRLYEVNDPNKREKLGSHQREVFLFNDTLMVTKIFNKKKNVVTYTLRQMFPLCGMQVYLFETPHYKHGIRLKTNLDGKVLITFNARNEHDRSKFVEDLREAILEMNEMEALRIDEELQKQKYTPSHHHTFNRMSDQAAIGMVDIEMLTPGGDPGINRLSAPECSGLKKTALSNSLIDLTDGTPRRGSGASLDSGMHSASSGSTTSREDNVPASKALKSITSTSRFAGLFGKKSKSASAVGKTVKNATSDSSEV